MGWRGGFRWRYFVHNVVWGCIGNLAMPRFSRFESLVIVVVLSEDVACSPYANLAVQVRPKRWLLAWRGTYPVSLATLKLLSGRLRRSKHPPFSLRGGGALLFTHVYCLLSVHRVPLEISTAQSSMSRLLSFGRVRYRHAVNRHHLPTSSSFLAALFASMALGSPAPFPSASRALNSCDFHPRENRVVQIVPC